jgi:hypothetical protein
VRAGDATWQGNGQYEIWIILGKFLQAMAIHNPTLTHSQLLHVREKQRTTVLFGRQRGLYTIDGFPTKLK